MLFPRRYYLSNAFAYRGAVISQDLQAAVDKSKPSQRRLGNLHNLDNEMFLSDRSLPCNTRTQPKILYTFKKIRYGK